MTPAGASRIAAALYSRRHATTAFVYRDEGNRYTWAAVEFMTAPTPSLPEWVYHKGEMIKSPPKEKAA